MSGAGFLVTLSTSFLSAVLLCSGLGKLATPRHTRQLFVELLRVRRGTALTLVRAVAVVETVVGAGLLLPASRGAAAAAATGLGASFAAAGLVGWSRRTTLPCGCFGRPERRPLGVTNVLIGAAVVVLGVVVLALDPSAVLPPDRMAIVTASLVVGLALLLWRGMVVDLVRPRTGASVKS
ncbi:Methylamine utilisation protein MauE [Micromonospora viridifaciens]|uniref:Methylamine utilisation protein MauE n=1 Tax=Micromonospora viridifaciens TaxID=1881 RepID=A0A1C4V4B6_MICVI|nr:MauE/DoxX family redox-associated membrane protein [Micromonospora viridifaciens]SCE78726.1 Methylamine utilisation protein MauE [Micromonospora viridifaciens]